ncbi:MAG TPA: hypothetical protein VE153_30435 [Myxococcus sp.]|nr:hypothetical protein [Myxococcus sp.]
MLRTALLMLVPFVLVACDSGHRTTVTYAISIHEGDVSGRTLTEDTHIDTDDDQWQAFLAAARTELGEEPQEFEVTSARVQLDIAHSRGVAKLEELLVEEGALFLQAGDNGAQVDIATFEDPEGTAQLEVDTTGDELTQLNAAMLASDFRLGLRGITPKTRDSDFDATIRVTLDVVAR